MLCRERFWVVVDLKKHHRNSLNKRTNVLVSCGRSLLRHESGAVLFPRCNSTFNRSSAGCLLLSCCAFRLPRIAEYFQVGMGPSINVCPKLAPTSLNSVHILSQESNPLPIWTWHRVSPWGDDWCPMKHVQQSQEWSQEEIWGGS